MTLTLLVGLNTINVSALDVYYEPKENIWGYFDPVGSISGLKTDIRSRVSFVLWSPHTLHGPWGNSTDFLTDTWLQIMN